MIYYTIINLYQTNNGYNKIGGDRIENKAVGNILELLPYLKINT